jgi:hypothetical protein
MSDTKNTQHTPKDKEPTVKPAPIAPAPSGQALKAQEPTVKP